jgi:Putative prokaryotic signal transducing protein
MNLVTIATSFFLAEAELVRSRLEAAEFHPFIANEMAAGWLGGTSTATLLHIQVPEAEEADAKEFLDAPVE